jgi:L-ribulose-5-phosphate 3-epimerase
MRKGVNQWCFPESWSLEKQFAEAARAGFDAVELNVAEADAPGLTLKSTAADAQRLTALATQHGLAIPSIATGLHWSFPLTATDATRGIDIVRHMLELAEAAGARTILVVPGLVTPDVPYDVAYGRALQVLTRLGQEAAAHKVTIGVENVWNRFLLSPLEFRSFLDQIGSPWVKAYFDCGNVLVHGFPEQWIRILGERIAAIHVKDFKLSVGSIQGFTGLLQGDVDWPAVRQALADTGYDGYVTVEIPPTAHCQAGSLELTGRALDLLLAKPES